MDAIFYCTVSDAYQNVSDVYYGPAPTDAEFIGLYLQLDTRNIKLL